MKKYTLIPVEQKINDTRLTFSEIIEAVPKNIRNKMKALLSHIQRNGYIEWNDKGEITIDDTLIPNSQINDLIKCCIYLYKDFTPAGLEQFKAALGHINTPHTLIRGGALPPPGLPTKKRPPIIPTKKKWVWHQM